MRGRVGARGDDTEQALASAPICRAVLAITLADRAICAGGAKLESGWLRRRNRRLARGGARPRVLVPHEGNHPVASTRSNGLTFVLVGLDRPSGRGIPGCDRAPRPGSVVG